MQVQVESVNPVTKRITVTVPADKVKATVEQRYNELGKVAQVKGFRKGKAPRRVLEQMYKPRVDSDVIQALVEDTYPKVLEEQKLSPVANPVIHETHLKDGEDFRYIATVEVKPQFDVPNYKGFNLKVTNKPVDDAAIDEQLKLLRERKSQLVPMLEDRPLAKGDFAVVDNETYVGGAPTKDAHSEDVVLELGSDHLIEEFETGLPGMKVGETRAVEVTFPEDHGEEKLAGKKVLYRVTLKGIKKKEMPELSEEFAKEVGAESLDDLKTKIRAELTEHHEDERKRDLRTKLLDEILKGVTFDIPPAMLDRQLRALYESAQRVLGEQGRALDRASFENLQGGLKEQAERRVRELLVLEAISRVENLTVTEPDLDAHFERLAQRYQQPAAAVRAYYLQEGRINSLVNVLAEEKVLDFLEKQSSIGE